MNKLIIKLFLSAHDGDREILASLIKDEAEYVNFLWIFYCLLSTVDLNPYTIRYGFIWDNMGKVITILDKRLYPDKFLYLTFSSSFSEERYIKGDLDIIIKEIE